MTARMKDAVAAEVQQHNAAAADMSRAGSLQRHRSSALQHAETAKAAGKETSAGETAAG